MDVFDLADNLRAEFQEKGVSNEEFLLKIAETYDIKRVFVSSVASSLTRSQTNALRKSLRSVWMKPSICGLRLALGKSFCEIEGWSLPILIVCSFPTGFFR